MCPPLPLPLAQEPEPSASVAPLAELSARVAVFVSSAEVGRAFDTGGVFSTRGETPAARASFW